MEAAWQTLHDNLEQLRAVSRPGQDKLNVEKCLASTETYRKHVQDLVSRISEGGIIRPEDANRAITPFKEDFRSVARNTVAAAEEATAQAHRSGVLLEESLLLNITMTSLLVILPSGLILAWTVWLTREITARNIKLRQREDRLNSIINNVSELIYTLSPEGIVTFTSPAWSDKLGWEVIAIQGKSFAFHPSRRSA